MWHEKQNMIFPGQVTGPSGPQVTHLKNMLHPIPSGVPDTNFLPESGKKRKATTLDQQGNRVLDYYLPIGSGPKPKLDVVSEVNVHKNAVEMFSNQTPQEHNVRLEQFRNYQVHDPSKLSASWQINDANFANSAVEKVNSTSSMLLPQSFCHSGPSPLLKSSLGDFPETGWRPPTYSTFNPAEVPNFSSYLNPNDACMGKATFGPALMDEANNVHGNPVTSGNLTLEKHQMSSANMGPLRMSEKSFIKDDKLAHFVNFDGKTVGQDVTKFETPMEMKQSCQSPDMADIKDGPSNGAVSVETSLCTDRKESDRSYQNSQTEVRSDTAPSNMGLDAKVKGKDQDLGDYHIKNISKTEGPSMDIAKYSSGEKVPPENAGCPAKTHVGPEHEYDRHSGSPNLGGSKSNAGKVATTNAEKLWDGSIRLNASVNVSAVAFFKSGEKMPEVNWSESVEVKGKVRLEAFEKFIQELPRSRNRGLMVISLCWKVGSSKAGLKGMKEVAKGYKERARVGFAQLSPGIDLYVCPRSDTIITILAKYGFFKGMAAVEDDQDSLIGCVVWRKNRISSNSVSKKSEKKNASLPEKPINSPSDSQKTAEVTQIISPTQPSEGSKPGCETVPSATESSGNMGSKNRIVQSSMVHVKSGSPMSTPTQNNTPISVGSQAASHAEARSPQGPMEQSMEVEIPPRCSSKPEKPDSSSKPLRHIPPIPSQKVKQIPLAPPDDDDLPEFDFRTTSVVSQTPPKSLLSCNSVNVLDAIQLVKKLSAEGIRNIDGSMLQKLPVQPKSVTSHQGPQNPAFPGIKLDTNQGSQPKRVGDHEPQMPLLHHIKGKPVEHSNEVPKPANFAAIFPQKNLWNDDDMPEWCPPDLEHENRSPPVASIRPSIPNIRCSVPNPPLGKVPPVPPLPLIPSTSQVLNHPLPHLQGSIGGFPHCPVTITVKPAQPRSVGFNQRCPSSSFVLNPNPSLRPGSNPFDVQRSTGSPGWRGWRRP
ncbi:PREDICTED: uncharacterized protein LOC104592507 [Nelumbo nucifera]|uniref:Uncharacterized protein LOC104592507 n=1 Tax=Nelumbo nucifera TaxID=4432 RepID=A0A1U7Z9S5_NELNU|nr:PREDICTED: uncharacterized protein LOC104592507 [Nelumbo nucifera]XP_010250217.1 PREDICTED: uncharacterized protein LOC104592507 [Nelumbo nucifera]